jgi:hypothetical protein
MTLEGAKAEALRRTTVLRTTHYVIELLFEEDSYLVTNWVPRGMTPVHTYFPDGSEL